MRRGGRGGAWAACGRLVLVVASGVCETKHERRWMKEAQRAEGERGTRKVEVRASSVGEPPASAAFGPGPEPIFIGRGVASASNTCYCPEQWVPVSCNGRPIKTKPPIGRCWETFFSMFAYCGLVVEIQPLNS